MRKSKKLLALLMAGAMTLSLAACGGGSGSSSAAAGSEAGGGEEKSVYRTLYASEVETMNYLVTSSAYEFAIGANVIDNLIEYDCYGNVKPALATSWEHNDDMTEWTFHIREGVKWVDYEGNEVADVTANDWVTTAQYVNDAHHDSGNQYMYNTGSVITNAQAYYDYTAYQMECEANGFEEGDPNATDSDGEPLEVVEPVDPATIGVTATDDYTLVFHLDQPCPFFISVLNYTTFMPAYGPFVEEQGDQFGLDNENMLYCGAYILSSFEPQVEHVMTKNQSYWDKDNVFIDEIRETYNAEAESLGVQLYEAGEVDSASIDNSLLDSMLADPETADSIHGVRRGIQYSYFYSFNFDVDDEEHGGYTVDEQYEPENWKKAVNNINFRMAVARALDRVRALTAYDPHEPESLLNNTITPATFAIGDGVDYTQYDALKRYTNGDSFNAEEAVAYRDQARAELEADGATFPIKVYMRYNPTMSDWANECQMVEQQLEGTLGSDFIDIIIEAGPESGFLGERRQGHYMLMSTNWGADYADPQTFTEPFGIDNSYGAWDQSEDPVTKALFAQWYELVYGTEAAIAEGLRDADIPEEDWVAGAAQIYDDEQARYAAFAEAEALLIENAICIPYSVEQDSAYTISKLNPLEGQFAPYGVSSERYKYQKLYDKSMNMEEFDAAFEQWKSEREAAIAE